MMIMEKFLALVAEHIEIKARSSIRGFTKCFVCDYFPEVIMVYISSFTCKTAINSRLENPVDLCSSCMSTWFLDMLRPQPVDLP